MGGPGKQARGRRPGNRIRRWLRVPLVLLVIYFLYLAGLFLIQRQIVFPGQSRVAGAGAPPIKGIEIWRIPHDGAEVEAWYIPPPRAATTRSTAVVFVHGNNELIDDWPHRLERYADLGVALLLVEFPGYGRSGGSPSEESIASVLTAAYDRLVARPGAQSGRVLVHGRSLGGGGACALAAQRPVAGIVLESTFTGLRGMAAEFWAPGFLVRDPFDNLAVLERYEGPVLVFHGRMDQLVPHDNGAALAAAARNGRLVSLECGHNDCPPDENVYWHEIEGLLRQVLTGPQAGGSD